MLGISYSAWLVRSTGQVLEFNLTATGIKDQYSSVCNKPPLGLITDHILRKYQESKTAESGERTAEGRQISRAKGHHDSRHQDITTHARFKTQDIIRWQPQHDVNAWYRKTIESTTSVSSLHRVTTGHRRLTAECKPEWTDRSRMQTDSAQLVPYHTSVVFCTVRRDVFIAVQLYRWVLPLRHHRLAGYRAT